MDTLTVTLAIAGLVCFGFMIFGAYVAVSLLREEINRRWCGFQRRIFEDGMDFGQRKISVYHYNFKNIV